MTPGHELVYEELGCTRGIGEIGEEYTAGGGVSPPVPVIGTSATLLFQEPGDIAMCVRRARSLQTHHLVVWFR